LLVPFLGGIMSGQYLQDVLTIIPLAILSFFGIAMMIMIVFRPVLPYRHRWIPGLIINIVLVLSGFCHNRIFFQNPFDLPESETGKPIYFAGKVISIPEPKRKSVMMVLEIRLLNNHIGNTTTKVTAGFSTDSGADTLEYGDLLICKGRFQEVMPPLNPGQFDYRRYLALQGIQWQVFISDGGWKLLERQHWKGLKSLSLSFREKLNRILMFYITDPENAAIARAMLLGDDEGLSEDQRKAFSGAGAMHVLCVSGLHVGVVYLLINALLGKLKRKRWTNIIRVSLLLASIWMYALITGMSPSVMRAATMLSFIISGQVYRQRPDIYNSIAASAFFLLLTNPGIIFSLGFQLSYLAVIGIVSFQPLLYQTLYCRWKITAKIWALITVSIAAQAFTAPLAIYHFHQFPSYFLLTNLVVVPLSSLVIYTGIGMFTASVFRETAEWTAYIFDKILGFMNYMVAFIKNMEGSVIDGITINTPQCILCYVILVAGIIWFNAANRYSRMALLISLTLLFTVSTLSKKQKLSQERIIIYGIRGSTAIDFISGKNHVILADTTLLLDQRSFSFHLGGNHLRSGLNNHIPVIIEKDTLIHNKELLFIKNGPLIFFNGYRVLILSDIAGFEAVGYCENNAVLIKDLPGTVQLQEKEFPDSLPIILDGTLANYKKEILINELSGKTRIHDLLSDGAFILEIKK
ncbi:MAG: ComEC family competence protein, partial [Bacteroidetes bacterium]|nr:ComEC family competence protein [Bacteroidota bacterium]